MFAFTCYLSHSTWQQLYLYTFSSFLVFIRRIQFRQQNPTRLQNALCKALKFTRKGRRLKTHLTVAGYKLVERSGRSFFTLGTYCQRPKSDNAV